MDKERILCDRCKQREASCHYRRIINGKESLLHLCSKCASSGGTGDFFGFFPFLHSVPQAEAEKRCDLCGSSFTEILENGKVGCPRCYSCFARELEGSIRRIHGDRVYKPDDEPSEKVKTDIPVQSVPRPDPIADAKKRLNDAVLREDYEQAAALRDAIRAMEKEG